MTSNLLTPLIEANVAAAVAIIAVLALRRPARSLIGAQSAYALWLIVPTAMLAPLLPARVIKVAGPAPTPGPSAIANGFDLPAGLLPHATPLALAATRTGAAIDIASVLVGAWLTGMGLSLVLLAIGQRRALARFGLIAADTADPRLARASNADVGPAIVGVFRPKLIVPLDFEARFDPREQAMVLTHERTHLASGHALINALASLIQAVNWFNPLIHLAARYARIDQELACDAAVVGRFPGERRTYAQALLKTQVVVAELPFGCAWPARSSSLLGQRIEMLGRERPGRLRLLVGAAVVAALTGGAGAAAWSAEPPIQVFAAPAAPPQPPAPPPAAKPAVLQLAAATSPPPVVPHASPATPAPSASATPSPPAAAIAPPDQPTPPTDVAQRLAEQQAPRQLVPFDPASFDNFAGYYAFGASSVLKISRDGGKYFVQLSGQGPVEVYPESQTKFFATVVAAQFSFVVDQHGAATEVVLHQGGQEPHAKRIDAAAGAALQAAFVQRVKADQPSPGTEASLRRYLASLEAGQPDFDEMTPGLAKAVREQLPSIDAYINRVGALKSVSFLVVDSRGLDVYKVDFERGSALWMVGPLTADGKVDIRGYKAVP